MPTPSRPEDLATLLAGEPCPHEHVTAIVNLFVWSADQIALAAVFPHLTTLVVESVSNGDLAVLAPFAELATLRSLHMTVTQLASLSLGTWLRVAATHRELAIEIQVLDIRTSSAVLQIRDAGRALAVDVGAFPSYPLHRVLADVAPGQLERVDLSVSPALDVRWAVQRETRRIGAKLVMPPVPSPPRRS